MKIKWPLFDIASGNPIVGGASFTLIKIKRLADDYFLDWSDMAFKDVGITSITSQMDEMDSVNFQGFYEKEIDVSGWDDGRYIVYTKYTSSPVQNGTEEIEIRNGKRYHPSPWGDSIYPATWGLFDNAGSEITGAGPSIEFKIRRESDGYMLDWNDLVFKNSGWTALNTTMTETDPINEKGFYDKDVDVSTWTDGIYLLVFRYSGSVVRNGFVELYIGDYEIPLPYSRRNALQIVQEIQKRLKLPQSTSIIAPHAQLILAYVNEIISIVPSSYIWDDLKYFGTINTVAGETIIQLGVTNRYIDTIRNLSIGNNPPIEMLNDEEFREYKRVATTPSRPLYYRIYSRSGGYVNIEVSPEPDQVYTIDYELLLKPVFLTSELDVPLIDDELLILGGVMKAREGQGDAYDLAAEEFSAKLEGEAGIQSEVLQGDVEVYG